MNEFNERIAATGLVPIIKLNHPERTLRHWEERSAQAVYIPRRSPSAQPVQRKRSH